MTKQFREAQIEFYIYWVARLNFDYGTIIGGNQFIDPNERVHIPKEQGLRNLELRMKRELSRPINEGGI